MTEDRKGKRANRARMATTGELYTLARRRSASNPQDRQGVVLAQQLHVDLVAALRRAGWPVEAERRPDCGEYYSYPGPAWLAVGRPDQLSSVVGDQDEDPDDESRVDLTRPPQIQVIAPQLDAGDGFRVQASLDGQRPVDDLVAALADLLVDGRAEALRTAADDAACSICGDRYPTKHLLAPTGTERVAVCPACVFDGDLLHGGSTAALAGQLDWLLATDLAAPAGWSAVAALLATAARPGLGRCLQAQWRRSGVVTLPSWWWSSPGDIWIWLPPAPNRPHPLDGFGPGAGLAAIVRAVDSAHPHLRQQVHDRLREAHAEAGAEEPADGFAEAIWPAVLAYVVAFTTQAAERPTHRAPLEHVGESFATFADHLGQLGSSLDDLDIELTLSAGLEVVGDALARAE
jgi:hypothetical protein